MKMRSVVVHLGIVKIAVNGTEGVCVVCVCVVIFLFERQSQERQR